MRLPSTPTGSPSLMHVVRLGADRALDVVQSPPRRFGVPADTALVPWFAGDAPLRVNLVLTQRGVGVGDPGHLPAGSAVIECGHVDRRADEVFPHQLVGVATCDAFELAVGVGGRVNPDRPLGATE